MGLGKRVLDAVAFAKFAKTALWFREASIYPHPRHPPSSPEV